MAITLEKFVKATGAEEVAGNVIVGVMSGRKIVGTVEGGVFNLNDAGKAIAEQIEDGTYGKDVVVEAQDEGVEAKKEVVDAPAEGKKKSK